VLSRGFLFAWATGRNLRPVRPGRSGRSGCARFVRATGVLMLALHLIPALTTVAAGISHSLYHLSTRMAAAQAEWQAAALDASRYVHQHGPNGVVHSHARIVDFALHSADDRESEDPQERALVDIRVDKYVSPPTLRMGETIRYSRSDMPSTPFITAATARPPVPPPKV
jgi:hypothetical protein